MQPKPCPLCAVEMVSTTGRARKYRWEHPATGCPLSAFRINTLDLERWNTRPAENQIAGLDHTLTMIAEGCEEQVADARTSAINTTGWPQEVVDFIEETGRRLRAVLEQLTPRQATDAEHIRQLKGCLALIATGCEEEEVNCRAGDVDLSMLADHLQAMANGARHHIARANGMAGRDPLREAIDERCLYSNPAILDAAADEIDCCPTCVHVWYEGDTNASGCHESEAGRYCPNDLAETLRAIAKCAREQGQ